jgi:hypothetical protein
MPVKKDGPGKALIVLLAGILGGFLPVAACCYVTPCAHAMHFWSQWQNNSVVMKKGAEYSAFFIREAPAG